MEAFQRKRKTNKNNRFETHLHTACKTSKFEAFESEWKKFIQFYSYTRITTTETKAKKSQYNNILAVWNSVFCDSSLIFLFLRLSKCVCIFFISSSDS